VVRTVLEHGSLKNAAQELGKRRSKVMETFERALQRLAAGLDPSERRGE
jgi:DNA-directed RNA polymerase specialized sigma24 family protein